mmetsp:Transcript_13033/g.11525  ORF Transcript_13033/g.11525 Transcript_13033/m.11525 type:complete len:141 (-) Transcript_13033:33-455(-)
MKYLQRAEAGAQEINNDDLGETLKNMKNPTKEDSLEMLSLLNKIQKDPKMKNMLSAKTMDKYTKIYEKKFVGRNLEAKDKKNAESLDNKYDMYGNNFLDYIEDISKAPAKLGKQYLRKMEVSFRDMRNKNLFYNLNDVKK